MKVKQALKHKKKLATKMNQEFVRVNMYNSVEEGATRVYDVKEAMQNWLKMIDELVELKTKIHLANAPVYGKIFRMSELKSQLSNLRQLDCVDGKHFDRYGRGEAVIKTAEISVLERDQMVLKIEEEIERLQEELDEHNATTSI
ncbi:MAG: hypothetical protein EBS33_03110 [Alphaproteobacteria bacterium]|nr:hypothetical protein [Alphaproteobacteria bacterium]